MDTIKILASVDAIEKAAMTRAKDLVQSFEMQQAVLARAKEIRQSLEAATTGTKATVTTPAKTTPKLTSSELMAKYRSLSGAPRQKFFDENIDAIWVAHAAERAANSSS